MCLFIFILKFILNCSERLYLEKNFFPWIDKAYIWEGIFCPFLEVSLSEITYLWGIGLHASQFS